MESQDQRWKEMRRSPRVRVEVNARQGIPELAMQKSDALGQQLRLRINNNQAFGPRRPASAAGEVEEEEVKGEHSQMLETNALIVCLFFYKSWLKVLLTDLM